MILIRKMFICTGLALMLSACATSYDTEKHFWSFGKGFETVQIASDSWQISFVGNTNTDRALARKYVMRKSAELCKQAGYAYFTFTREQTDRDAVGQFGVGKNSRDDIMWGTSTMNQETSVMVEVTGLPSKPENASSRIYETDYILSHVNVKS
ncbi:MULTISPECIES: CC0125/CC1285 family lipoprotein [Shewanella]|jgi:hypothetical protein|uniref:Lipoprotein n=3 Tax=Shewanella putrefaciens TaxID=24 RepID=E6XL58_SHEP2|nr:MULTISPECIES: hypothetical protein [Shewanella]CAD6366005.1 hypothetical protein SHEWT2_03895 [Shewanella hafniensis]MCK7630357.1 hypothetical protein [Shewanella sp. JNE9-1]MCK7633534.1 hypothetical protein [Shewanella sp. JNE17]MCK7645524.1 hypothetical protein [Shewanella sp. JNE3-1]MCK7648707.1 hypothetical protein [Shewanella sp. JNE8]